MVNDFLKIFSGGWEKFIVIATSYNNTHCKSNFLFEKRESGWGNFAQSIATKLNEAKGYRHVVLTIPAKFRVIFYKNRLKQDLYGAFMAMGWASGRIWRIHRCLL